MTPGGFCIMPSLEDQIRDRLQRCTRGEESVEEFQGWFVPISWNIEQSGEQEAIKLAYQIDGMLAESSSANWPDKDLKEELSRIAIPLAGSRRADRH